jgi:2-oxoglutarate ferredoxin oxidoreductase subunit delta
VSNKDKKKGPHGEVVVVSEKTGHKITILEEFCKGCQICVEVCPTDVLKMESVGTRWQGSVAVVADADACIACMLCDIQCPDFAIEVLKGDKKKKKKSDAA